MNKGAQTVQRAITHTDGRQEPGAQSHLTQSHLNVTSPPPPVHQRSEDTLTGAHTSADTCARAHHCPAHARAPSVGLTPNPSNLGTPSLAVNIRPPPCPLHAGSPIQLFTPGQPSCLLSGEGLLFLLQKQEREVTGAPAATRNVPSVTCCELLPHNDLSEHCGRRHILHCVSHIHLVFHWKSCPRLGPPFSPSLGEH